MSKLLFGVHLGNCEKEDAKAFDICLKLLQDEPGFIDTAIFTHRTSNEETLSRPLFLIDGSEEIASKALDMMKVYPQHSFIIISNLDVACQHFTTGSADDSTEKETRVIGKWKQVDPKDSKSLMNTIYLPKTHKCFTIEVGG